MNQKSRWRNDHPNIRAAVHGAADLPRAEEMSDHSELKKAATPEESGPLCGFRVDGSVCRIEMGVDSLSDGYKQFTPTIKKADKVELLPCPLCGGRVKASAYYAGQDGALPRISCNCGLKYEGLCSEESLARCWNRRKP